MSDEIFRIVIAAGVVLASIAFVVQAAIVFAIYRGSRKMEDKTAAFMGRIEPMILKVGPALDKAGPILDEIGPVLKRIGPVMEKTGHVMDKVPAVFDKVQLVVGQAGVLIQRGSEVAVSINSVVASTNKILVDARPQLHEISSEAVATVRNAREQVERVGDLLHDAGDLARTRIEQIDKAVTSTVEQVEQVGDSVKSAVMRPVREVNGLAAGISAAVSTLVRGQRKSSVDAATQDEEMFI